MTKRKTQIIILAAATTAFLGGYIYWRDELAVRHRMQELKATEFDLGPVLREAYGDPTNRLLVRTKSPESDGLLFKASRGLTVLEYDSSIGSLILPNRIHGTQRPVRLLMRPNFCAVIAAGSTTPSTGC